MASVADGDGAGQEFRAAAEEFQAARAACTAAFEQVRSGDQRSLQRYVRARERLDAALERLAGYSYASGAAAGDDNGVAAGHVPDADAEPDDEPGMTGLREPPGRAGAPDRSMGGVGSSGSHARFSAA